MRCTPPPHCSSSQPSQHCSCSQPPQRHSTPPHNRCGRSSSWVDWLIAGFFINSITVKSIHMSPLLPAEVQDTICDVLMAQQNEFLTANLLRVSWGPFKRMIQSWNTTYYLQNEADCSDSKYRYIKHQ